ncbi:MAG TPA: hypothetical protein VJN72_03535 [Gaiellales bacterium]|nr:hypothetical protein [Gaiellales bacterium]
MIRRFRTASDDYETPAPAVESRGWTPAVIVPAVLLMVLGAWVFVAPLVGPYFSFGFDTSSRWQFTNDHWLLSLAPGVALFVAGLLMTVRSRAIGWLAGLVAVAAGVWLVIGPTLHSTWSSHVFSPLPGSEWKTAARWIADFYGPGALAIYLGAQAQGLLERRSTVRTVTQTPPQATRTAPAEHDVPERDAEQETMVSSGRESS